MRIRFTREAELPRISPNDGTICHQLQISRYKYCSFVRTHLPSSSHFRTNGFRQLRKGVQRRIGRMVSGMEGLRDVCGANGANMLPWVAWAWEWCGVQQRGIGGTNCNTWSAEFSVQASCFVLFRQTADQQLKTSSISLDDVPPERC